ncbi:hypothetical protein ACTFR8_24655 [Bacillus cereus group sp. MYBK15-3]|uniref:hypothetical protein n=1 Tax=Bacillus cereus group TaxID=86661 RepID=UPI001C8CCA43|nr:hypothetical protein [Bacillus cereus]MBX9158789.1 hypothetical protein [Bacillus cereus]
MEYTKKGELVTKMFRDAFRTRPGMGMSGSGQPLDVQLNEFLQVNKHIKIENREFHRTVNELNDGSFYVIETELVYFRLYYPEDKKDEKDKTNKE